MLLLMSPDSATSLPRLFRTALRECDLGADEAPLAI